MEGEDKQRVAAYHLDYLTGDGLACFSPGEMNRQVEMWICSSVNRPIQGAPCSGWKTKPVTRKEYEMLATRPKSTQAQQTGTACGLRRAIRKGAAVTACCCDQ